MAGKLSTCHLWVSKSLIFRDVMLTLFQSQKGLCLILSPTVYLHLSLQFISSPLQRMGVCARLCGSVPGKEVVEERIPIVNKVAILCNTLTSPSSLVSLLLENGASCLSLFFGVFGCMLHFLCMSFGSNCDCVHLPVCCSRMCSSVYEECLFFLPCLFLM